MSFDLAQVADILVCPACHGKVVMDGDTLVDVSPECRRAFQIQDGIPRLLVGESTELSVDDWGQVMSRSGRDVATGEPTEQPNT